MAINYHQNKHRRTDAAEGPDRFGVRRWTKDMGADLFLRYHGLEFVRRLKDGHQPGWYLNRLLRAAGIASQTGFSLFHLKASETADLDVLPF